MVGHTIQDCLEFQRRVQDLIDEKEIEFSSKGEHFINVITNTTYSGNPSPNGLRPITIFHDNSHVKVETSEAPKPVLVIEVPKPFPYTSNKTVPWDYRYNYANEMAATDLTGVRGITRSGRVYMPTIMDKVTLEKPSTLVEKEQASQEKKYGSTFEKESQPIVEKEACEFLKFVKHSEYNVVEQSNKMPASISMLSLLQNSNLHRNALLKALDKAYVA